MSNFFIANLMILIGVISFIMLSNHYLILLLSLEFMMLSLLMFSSIQNQFMIKEISLIFLFICMMIMEGIFGLALLIVSSQTYGKDYILLLK